MSKVARTCASLSVAALIGVLCGCGGSGGHSGPPSPAKSSTLAAPSPASTAPLNASDFVLTDADAPAGLMSVPESQGPTDLAEPAFLAAMQTCLGGGQSDNGSADGATFTDSAYSDAMTTIAELEPASEVAADTRHFASGQNVSTALDCLANRTRPFFAGLGSRLDGVTALDASPYHDVLLAFAVKVTGQISGTPTDVEQDIYILGRGRVEQIVAFLFPAQNDVGTITSDMLSRLEEKLQHQ